MDWIADTDALAALYGEPGPAAVRKVAHRLTPEYRRWIAASRFCILSTVGPEGTDGSPRGDDGAVVRIVDDVTLWLPDWRGNERVDCLHNLVRDPRVSLLFLVPGSGNVVRVNAEGRVTADAAACASFAGGIHGERAPRSVIVIRIAEVYVQCARAILRSRLWSAGDESGGLPSVGEILAGLTAGEMGGDAYDRAWPGRAAASLW